MQIYAKRISPTRVRVESEAGYANVVIEEGWEDEADDEGQPISKDYVEIDYIQTHANFQKKGYGRQLLKAAILVAYRTGLPIYIKAHEYDKKTIPLDNLVEFYESEGFTIQDVSGGNVILSMDGGKNGEYFAYDAIYDSEPNGKIPIERFAPNTTTYQKESLSPSTYTPLREVKKSTRNASKTQPDDGTTFLGYHGTGAVFSQFDPSFTGKGDDQYGSGFYFVNDKQHALGYANKAKTGNPTVITAYITLKNPIYLDEDTDTLDNYINVSPSQATQIILKVPNIFDRDSSPLVDWFEATGARYTRSDVMKVAKEYSKLGDIENDFFKGDSGGFRKAVYEVLGYDGVVKKFYKDNIIFYIAWFPEQIRIIQDTKDSLNTVPFMESSIPDADEKQKQILKSWIDTTYEQGDAKLLKTYKARYKLLFGKNYNPETMRKPRVPSLDTLYHKEDFHFYSDYIKYAHDLFSIKFKEYKKYITDAYTKSIDLEELVSYLQHEGIQSHIVFKPQSTHIAYVEGSTIYFNFDNPHFPGMLLPVEIVVHELGHVFEKEYNLESSEALVSPKHEYASSSYGIYLNPSELFAENFKNYFLEPLYLQKGWPQVYQEMDSLIPTAWKRLILGIIEFSERS